MADLTHTAMLWLPQALRDAGYNVITLDGWEEAQGYYFWTQPQEGTIGDFDEPPKLFMVHHTAGTRATPVVRSFSGEWSKANVWIGVLRNGRLYSYGDGVPTAVFTASGPARISSGYGHWPTAVRVMPTVRRFRTGPPTSHSLRGSRVRPPSKRIMATPRCTSTVSISSPRAAGEKTARPAGPPPAITRSCTPQPFLPEPRPFKPTSA